MIALALPLFLVAGWPLEGWAAAALLWVGAQALGLLLARVKPSPDNLAASGVLAFGMMARLLVMLAVLLALVASRQGGRPGGRARLRRRLHRRARLLAARLLHPGAAGMRRAARHDDALPRLARAGLRARRLRPDDRVRAARMGLDPPRPAQPLDHEGGRLPDARHRPDDPARALPDARQDAQPPADGRRVDLRGRAGADRRAGPAVEGDRPLVPVRGDPVDLHLRDQPDRVHSPPDHRRDLPRLPGLGHLRRHLVALRDAGAGRS